VKSNDVQELNWQQSTMEHPQKTKYIKKTKRSSDENLDVITPTALQQ